MILVIKIFESEPWLILPGNSVQIQVCTCTYHIGHCFPFITCGENIHNIKLPILMIFLWEVFPLCLKTACGYFDTRLAYAHLQSNMKSMSFPSVLGHLIKKVAGP